MEDRNEEEREHECIIPRPDAQGGDAAGGGSADAGPSDNDGTAEGQDEIRPAETPDDLNDLVESECGVALVYKCGRCGKTGFLPDPGAMMAAGRGIGVAAKCAVCGGGLMLLTKEAKKAKGQMVQPANVTQMPRNRMERQEALAKIRLAMQGGRIK